MRIAFLVTHLLGTGHLARTAQIADAFAMAGHEALVLSGGVPAPLAAPKAARLQQLPAIRSDASFTTLTDAAGDVAGEATFAARIEAIRAAMRDFAPDALVTELFPFGRRKLTAEFQAGIEAAQGALILCSIRDILQMPRKPGRKEEAEDRLTRSYDGILFHGDPALADLDASWPLPEGLQPLVRATGYIGDRTIGDGSGEDGQGEIVVAAGGGAVGQAVFKASIKAAKLSDVPWRLLVGRDHAVRTDLPSNVVMEPVRPDFRAVLSRCQVGVLQCGYNTAMDVIATGARAVFCPFEGDGETEQLQRTRAMSERYGTGIVREDELTGESLAEAVRLALAGPKPDYSALSLDGAARSVGIVEAMLEAQG